MTSKFKHQWYSSTYFLFQTSSCEPRKQQVTGARIQGMPQGTHPGLAIREIYFIPSTCFWMITKLMPQQWFYSWNLNCTVHLHVMNSSCSLGNNTRTLYQTRDGNFASPRLIPAPICLWPQHKGKSSCRHPPHPFLHPSKIHTTYVATEVWGYRKAVGEKRALQPLLPAVVKSQCMSGRHRIPITHVIQSPHIAPFKTQGVGNL